MSTADDVGVCVYVCMCMCRASPTSETPPAGLRWLGALARTRKGTIGDPGAALCSAAGRALCHCAAGMARREAMKMRDKLVAMPVRRDCPLGVRQGMPGLRAVCRGCRLVALASVIIILQEDELPVKLVGGSWKARTVRASTQRTQNERKKQIQGRRASTVVVGI